MGALETIEEVDLGLDVRDQGAGEVVAQSGTDTMRWTVSSARSSAIG